MDTGLFAENCSIEMTCVNSSLSHEAFISNLNGTSPSEVLLMTFVVPASSLCWSFAPSISVPFLGYYRRNIAEAFFLSFILLLALTIWSDHIAVLLSTQLACILIFGFITLKSQKFSHLLAKDLAFYKENGAEYMTEKHLHEKVPIWQMTVKNRSNHIAFVSDYRGHMLLATSISILAVDFSIFPRSFAKTENFGWSIMDAGVGCFVAVHGICSPFSRETSNGNMYYISKSVKSSLPLIVLGFVRLAAVKAVNYHAHVSEYGVHWNFFFTLGITKIICSIVLTVSYSKLQSWVLAVIFAVLHQYLLSTVRVSEFLLCESRENLLQANKEGISSVLGFVTIYFISVEIGRFLRRPRYKLQEWIHVLASLIIIGCIGWIVMYIAHFVVQPTSRKMANLAYCVWITALLTLQLAVHLTEQLLSVFYQIIHLEPDDVSSTNDHEWYPVMDSCLLWKAINENGLAYFLLANMLTGFINITIDTVNVPSYLSVFVLSVYTLSLTALILIFSHFSVHLKFW